MGETYYCDDYEAVTGRKRGDEAPAVEAKVITVAEPAAPVTADVQVETKDAE